MEIKDIYVANYVLRFANALLRREDKCPETEEVPYTFTAIFDNGFEADIKVVNANPPYVDPVLFDDGGCEICVGEPGAWCVDGEYKFDYNGTEYIVNVCGSDGL